MKKYLERTQSRVIRVFISSTFRDMKDERDYLSKVIFPEIRESLKKRRLEFIEIDLRWGITDEEAKSGSVLKLCLDEIEHTRPYFIGILGGRYGWIPDQTDDRLKYYDHSLSITEMEFNYAAFHIDEHIYASFYIKDDAIISDEFKEIKGSLEEKKLNALKDRLRQQNQYHTYDYHSIDELGSLIKNHILNLIDQIFVYDAETSSIEDMIHAYYGQSRYNHYIPIPELDQLISEKKHFMIGGSKLSGKTTHMTHVLKTVANNDDTYVLYHFTQATPDSYKLSHLLNRFCQALLDDFMDEDITLSELRVDNNLLLELLEIASQSVKYLYVFIDGLEFLDDQIAAATLSFLSIHQLPPNVILVLTHQLTVCKNIYNRHQIPFIEITYLNDDQIRTFGSSYLLEYGKKLSHEGYDLITNQFHFKSIFFVKILMDELRIYGHHETLLDYVKKFLPLKNEVSFYTLILERLEHDFGLNVTRKLMCVLSATEKGLYEYEMKMLFDGVQAHYTGLLNAVSPYLFEHMGLYSINGYFFNAIQRRYMYSEELMVQEHTYMNDFFLNLWMNDMYDLRLAKEVCYTMKYSDQYDLMIKIFSDVPYFNFLYENEPLKMNFYFEEVYYYFDFIHRLIAAFDQLDVNQYDLEHRLRYLKSIVNFAYQYGDADSSLMYALHIITTYENLLETEMHHYLMCEIKLKLVEMALACNMPQSEVIGDEVYQTMREFQFESLYAQAYLIIADAKSANEKFDVAKHIYEVALGYADQQNNYEMIMRILHHMAHLAAKMDDFSKANEALNQSYDVYHRYIGIMCEPLIELKLAHADMLYMYSENYEKMIELYEECLLLYKHVTKLMKKQQYKLIYYKLGYAYHKIGRMDKSNECVKQYETLDAFFKNINYYSGHQK